MNSPCSDTTLHFIEVVKEKIFNPVTKNATDISITVYLELASIAGEISTDAKSQQHRDSFFKYLVKLTSIFTRYVLIRNAK